MRKKIQKVKPFSKKTKIEGFSFFCLGFFFLTPQKIFNEKKRLNLQKKKGAKKGFKLLFPLFFPFWEKKMKKKFKMNLKKFFKIGNWVPPQGFGGKKLPPPFFFLFPPNFPKKNKKTRNF